MEIANISTNLPGYNIAMTRFPNLTRSDYPDEIMLYTGSELNRVLNSTVSPNVTPPFTRYMPSASCHIDNFIGFYCRTILSVIALIGNISFVFVVSRVRAMRTIPNFHFINLAATDIVYILTELAYLTIFRLILDGSFSLETTQVIGSAFSKLWIFITPAFLVTALLTITLISIERYIAVCHPFKANLLNLRSRKRVIVLMTSTWIMGLAIGAFALYTNYYQMGTAAVVAYLTVFSCFTALPVCIVVACYGLVVANVILMKRPNSQRGRRGNGKMRSSRSSKEERNVLILCVAITLLFFLCFAPLAATQMIATISIITQDTAIQHDTLACLQTVQTMLQLVHLAISPLLYNVGSKIRRKAFRRAFYGKRIRFAKSNGSNRLKLGGSLCSSTRASTRTSEV
ncbi:growth hormone secretagogue receptor type 1-like [Glandiceps talaboti]